MSLMMLDLASDGRVYCLSNDGLDLFKTKPQCAIIQCLACIETFARKNLEITVESYEYEYEVSRF